MTWTVEDEREQCARLAAKMEAEEAEAVGNPMLGGEVLTPIADAIRRRRELLRAQGIRT